MILTALVTNAIVTVLAIVVLGVAFAAGIFALFCHGLKVHLNKRRDEERTDVPIIFKVLVAISLLLLGTRVQAAPAPVSISGSLTWTNSSGALVPVVPSIIVHVQGITAAAITNTGVLGPGVVIAQADGGEALGTMGSGMTLTGPPWVLSSIGGAGGVVVLQGTNMLLTTNGFLITLNSTTDTNMINTFLLSATNNDILRATAITNGGLNVLSNYVNTLSVNATNQSLKIGLNDTNQSLLIGLNATNNDIAVAAGANVTLVTNAGVVTISSAAGGSGTGIQTNGGTGFNNIGTNLTAWLSFTNQGLAAAGVVTNDANGKLYTTTRLAPPQIDLLQATNEALRQATALTNGAVNNLSNYVFTLSQNGTNESVLLTQNTTNEALRQATSLTNGAINNLSNYVFTLSQNGTNNTIRATNTISANQMTNTLSIQADTNIFSALGISHIQSLASAGGTGIQTNSGTGFNNNLTNLTAQGSLTGTNATSGYQFIPTGTNVTILEWNTNSAGVLQTNTMTIGSTPYLIEDANTNGVDAFTVTQDGKVTFGTNVTSWITTNGIAHFKGFVTENAWATNGVFTVFNVLDFGAIPNDGSSDKTAIQAAINAAATNGGTVYLPVGVYELGSSGGLILANNVQMVGSHAPNSGTGTRLNYTGTGDAIQLSDGAKMAMRHLFLNGNNAVDSIGFGTTNTTDLVNSTTHWVAEDVRVFGFKTGIFIHNSWVWELNTVYADNCVEGLVISNTTASGRVIGGEYSQCTNNIAIKGGQNFGITFSTSDESGRVGVRMTDENNSFNQDIRFINCHFEGNTNAVVVTNTQGFVFLGNVAESSGTNLVINGINTGVAIIGNYFGGQCPMNVANTTTTLESFGNYNNCTFISADSSLGGFSSGTNFVLHPASSLFGLVGSGNATNAAGSRVAYLTDVTAGSINVNGTNVQVGTSITTLGLWPTFGSANIYWQLTNSSGTMQLTPFLRDTLTNNTSGSAGKATNVDAGAYTFVANAAATAGNATAIPVSQVVTFASATNSLQLAPALFGTNFLLVSATPCNITNAINSTAGYLFAADLTVSNSTAATYTCRVDTAWVPRGWLATNLATGTLGFNGGTVAAAKELIIHVEARGINETNYWLSY